MTIKPNWRIVPHTRNAFGNLLWMAFTPLGQQVRIYPFLSIADAMKEINKRRNGNA